MVQMPVPSENRTADIRATVWHKSLLRLAPAGNTNKKKPRLHRPAMVVAATSLLVAAVARMTFLPPGIPIRLAIWSLPVLMAMAVEFRQTRSVHPIYLLGLAVFVVRRYSAPVVSGSDAWGSFATWVFRLVP